MAGEHVEVQGLGAAYRFSKVLVNRLSLKTAREWHKPTVEETESGMEVTSYLPAELDRV